VKKLAESVADDSILPDHYDQMTQAELKAFAHVPQIRKIPRHIGMKTGAV
jgi:hypothetical protein